MNFEDLLTRNRSYRRFHEDRPVDRRTLVELVELTRRCPSAGNRQPLKYLVTCVAGRERQGVSPSPLGRRAAGLERPGRR